MIHIVGAGPGAVDLITVRGQKLSSEAGVVIYADSLVSHDLPGWARQDTRIYDSASMGLKQVMEITEQAERDGPATVHLHTGNPCLYGAIREQMDGLDARGIKYGICSRVSSFYGAATALGMEYTLPGINQSMVITRMAGRTPVPERESIGKFVAHGSAMAIFLSAGMTGELSEGLVKGGYPGDTSAVIVYKAAWPGERVVRCTIATLEGMADRENIHETALIVVENIVAQTGYECSKLCDPASTTEFRTDRGIIPRKLEPGALYVMGMGPGEKKQMAGQALGVMGRCQVIAGYTIYVDLIRGSFPQKEFLTTAMTREEERCRKAFEYCMEGKNITMICSGDAGVYGMTGLILELAQQYPGARVRTVPGITAACVGATVLRAPLMHDFAIISLSDRLTFLENVRNRVEAAAQADFVIYLYNPASKGWSGFFRQAYSRILKYRVGDTIYGPAVNIGRGGEEMGVLTLEELKDHQVDMFTAVYIGSPHTRRIGPYMVMPRGYRYEGNWEECHTVYRDHGGKAAGGISSGA